jgi:SAM-dependent methyltransferase
VSLLRAGGLVGGTVVDLGCGSGIVARQVTEAGYDVLGYDISTDMLAIAAAEAPAATLRHGAALDAELPPAVAIAAVGEVLNYATDTRAGLDALEVVARRAHAALVAGGILLLDVATPGRNGPSLLRQQFHDRPQRTLYMRAEERDGSLERRITLFTREEDGAYRRSDERHLLRLYEPRDVVAALDRAGFDTELHPYYPAPSGQERPLPGWVVVLARPRPPA